MLAVLAAGAIAAAMQPASYPVAVLTAHDLETALTSYRAYKPTDEFAAAFSVAPYNGKRFRIEGPLRSEASSGPAGGNLGTYSYDATSQQLALGISTHARWNLRRLKERYPYEDFWKLPEVEGFEFRTTSRPGTIYVGQNGFGAKAQIKTTHYLSFGVSEFRPNWPRDPKRSSIRDYSVKLAVPPEEARALARSVRIVIEGELTEYLPGRMFGCESSYSAPTIDFPSEAFFESCFITAKINQVSIVNTATGKAIASWPGFPDR